MRGQFRKRLYERSEQHSYEETMSRSEILQTLANRREDLARMGVKSMALFGSVARDEARPDSDVDILVDFQ
jgi:predicted nucleotidyltransferase